ncbi:MAG: protein kinase [Nitrospirota bacterium]
MPEFEARYDSGLRDDGADTGNYGAKDTTGRKFNIQISRTYTILREFTHTGARGDVYLIEQNGLESILKFYRPEIVLNEEVIRKAKALNERLHNFVIYIYDYGFDENSKRWYVIQEYAKYGSLKDLSEPGVNLKTFNPVIKEIIAGLKVLHENNILNLNLKPSNILIRENKPPQPVFTDFYMSSVTESEHMKRITPFKGRPLYSSPELLAGAAGQEADYWSLGMTMLELLAGRHPFDNLDDKSIADILSAKGASVPEHIPEDYKILLKGLLTNDPGKRWGYPEVKRWLEKDTDIPVYFYDNKEGPREKISKTLTVPYKFLNKEYFSIREMIPAFLKNEEAWEAAKDHIRQGRISEWLLKNSDNQTCSKVDNIREQSAGDPDLAVISLIYTFKIDLPFILCGKLITRKNLHIFAGRILKNENSKGEELIINSLLNGKLIDYYREYMMLTSKSDDDLLNLFEAALKAVSGKKEHHEKLNALLKMLDILATPAAYMLPSRISGNLMANLDFIAGNIDVVISREKYNEMIGDLIIPEEMKEGINNSLSAGLSSEYLKGLEKLKEGSLLTKTEFNKLQDDYILPAWLEGDILGDETSRYVAVIKLLRKLKGEGLLIRKNDFLDYISKYIQFIGYVTDKKGVIQRGQKGETLEQRWIRLLKSDIGREDYIRLAEHIKNGVMLSMIPHIEEITTRVSSQTIFSDSMNEIIRYLEGLKSGKVKWDDADKQIVDEIHSLVLRKKNSHGQFFEKITGGVPGKFLRAFMKIVFGIDADVRTWEMESALAGVSGGACIGVIAWLIIAGLDLETSFYGPAALGLLLGLIRKSAPLALLCASAGFAGAFFLGLGTAIEVIYAFLISIAGAAVIGAFIGRKINKFSFYDDIFRKYNDRIYDVVNAAEAASNLS